MGSRGRILLAGKPSNKGTRVSLHSYGGIGLIRTPRLLGTAAEHLRQAAETLRTRSTAQDYQQKPHHRHCDCTELLHLLSPDCFIPTGIY
jgi:hypothetical protein